MKTEVTADLKNGSFQTERVFKTSLDLVWKAWTEAELLDLWWAPPPNQTETLNLDFSPGGKWVYDLVTPLGEREEKISIYKEIDPLNFFTFQEGFLDLSGKIDESIAAGFWKNTFTEEKSGTRVVTLVQFPSPEDLETFLKMEIDKDLILVYENLDEVLKTLKKQ